jgi:hypothetical protein
MITMASKHRTGYSMIGSTKLYYEYTVPTNESNVVNLTGQDVHIYQGEPLKNVYCFPKVPDVIKLKEKERKDVEYLLPNGSKIEIPLWSPHAFELASGVPEKYKGFDIILCYSVAKVFVEKHKHFYPRVLYPDMSPESVVKGGECGKKTVGVRRLAVLNRVPLLP